MTNQLKERVGLFYLKDDNVFIDGEGEIVFEIFELITPNDLYLFKKNKEDVVVNHCREVGTIVELYWPEPEIEEWRDECNDGI